MSSKQPLRVGIGGPVGSGKTALMEQLCKRLRDTYEIAAITNDIYTKEDARILVEAGADPSKIGRPQGELFIQDEARLREINARLGARIAILCVPAPAAQSVADAAISAGVRVILNFAPIILKVPERIVVRNVSFLQELAVLSYHLSSDTTK